MGEGKIEMVKNLYSSVAARFRWLGGNAAITKIAASATFGLLLFPLAASAQLYPPLKGGKGSGSAEWWNEEAYTPNILRGSTHIRSGASGYSNAENFAGIVSGRKNCDDLLLFVAKARNASLSAAEEEECALDEFYLRKGAVGDNRDIANVFARREVLAEYKLKVAARIKELRAAERFYIRSSSVKLSPYDLEKKRFTVQYGVPFYNVRIEALGLTQGNWITVPILVEEGLAKKIEVARLEKFGQAARVHRVMNELHFTVLDAFLKEGGDGKPERVLQIKVVATRVAIELPDGDIMNFGIGQLPDAK